jgi:acyl dehydratase
MITFEDLAPGTRLDLGRWRVDRDEAIAIARRWEPQPHHVDEAAAAASPFGGLTVCSLYLFGVCTRLFFDHDPPIAVLAMLGKDGLRLPHPARPGDVLVYTTEVVERRRSESRPDRGIVRLRDELAREAGEVVLAQDVTLLVRAAAVADEPNASG